jgi:hypothetical protein
VGFVGVTVSVVELIPASRDQVDDGEDHDPDDVDEVPVEPTISTVSARSVGSRPRSDMTSSDISMTMPTETCTPWKPVR